MAREHTGGFRCRVSPGHGVYDGCFFGSRAQLEAHQLASHKPYKCVFGVRRGVACPPPFCKWQYL
jgi:hypothetical protein